MFRDPIELTLLSSPHIGDGNLGDYGVSMLGTSWCGLSFFKSFYDYSPLPMGVVLAYPDDMLNLECNRAAAKFFGRPIKEVKNQFSVAMGAPKDCVTNWLKHYRQSAQTGQPVSFEYTSGCHGSDYVHWFCCTIYPIQDTSPEKQPIFAYIVNDITEKKLVELEAYKWKKKLETLVNNVDCIVWEMYSQTGEFAFVSNQGESILGYPWSSWRDYKSFMQEHVYPPDLELVPSIEKLTKSRKTETSFRMIKADGSLATIKMIVSVPEFSHSTIFGVMVDNTEQFRITELEQQTQEMLMKMKHKSQFVAEIIHEIRTPLNGVIGMTSLALEDFEMNEQQRSYIESSLNCAESLLSIVNNILDFTKIEAGKMEVESIPLNLRNVIEESASILSVKADEKDLDILVHYPTSLCDNIIGDPTRIQQILMNLVGNAIKFTSEGHIVISVTFNKNNLKITVSDTGIGVTDEQLTNLFNTFTQASKSTTRIYGGTGLGLSISKHLVELMGGEIGVRSTPNKGSDFWFTLPLRTANRKIAAPQTIHLRAQQRVLVADPSSFYCKILKEQLTLWGLSVTCTISSRDAMLELDNAYHYGIPYDVIILENQLVFDDKPFGVAIHNNPKYSNVALILLSRLSHRNQFHGTAATTLFSSCLLKPVPVARLHDSLCKIFAEKDVLQEDPNPAPTKGVKRTLTADVSLSFTPRVLVVDDNMINQKIAASMLQKLGCVVDVEENGRAALNRFISSPHAYDAIFMDVQMPQMNGYEASLAIRKYIQDSGKLELDCVTIIALTASVTDERMCLANGMQGFIIKPVRMQDFKNALQSIQQKRRELED